MTHIEQIALDYLWPYREKWVCPADIKCLPPDVFQGWNIEIKSESITLSRESEGHTFSLKKLIVRIEKEMGRFPERDASTPRELAKTLIRDSVERHYSLESIAQHGSGVSWYGYSVSVQGKRIVVSEFEGDRCAHVFDLREIYHEIELDLHRGYALVQPTLF